MIQVQNTWDYGPLNTVLSLQVGTFVVDAKTHYRARTNVTVPYVYEALELYPQFSLTDFTDKMLKIFQEERPSILFRRYQHGALLPPIPRLFTLANDGSFDDLHSIHIALSAKLRDKFYSHSDTDIYYKLFYKRGNRSWAHQIGIEAILLKLSIYHFKTKQHHPMDYTKRKHAHTFFIISRKAEFSPSLKSRS